MFQTVPLFHEKRLVIFGCSWVFSRKKKASHSGVVCGGWLSRLGCGTPCCTRCWRPGHRACWARRRGRTRARPGCRRGAGPRPLLAPGAGAPAGPMRLRGGAKDKGKGSKGKGKEDAVEGDDDGPQEIGGLRPEPYEEPEGLRVDFHAFKQKLREQVESGELQPSADLKARKKDSNVFAKVCAVQPARGPNPGPRARGRGCICAQVLSVRARPPARVRLLPPDDAASCAAHGWARVAERQCAGGLSQEISGRQSLAQSVRQCRQCS